eukprot:Blabericola_migrator_1__1350@NODE_1350_length_4748_cov_121_279855_g906_i0_p1_GENE_NODE_1350_length_4748_cov_121_279855_g906_i0NODE_1350_length_4748_cov_121_279855_g906_i0_p1_ORF_typecomplete_len1091_score173_17BRK/PF07533_16/1_1e03BRK/PF07533_16/3_6e03BRK/PF07533_16/1_4_NODE_1350_length_4748_cov_121_279855_g906_i06213893
MTADDGLNVESLKSESSTIIRLRTISRLSHNAVEWSSVIPSLSFRECVKLAHGLARVNRKELLSSFLPLMEPNTRLHCLFLSVSTDIEAEVQRAKEWSAQTWRLCCQRQPQLAAKLLTEDITQLPGWFQRPPKRRQTLIQPLLNTIAKHDPIAAVKVFIAFANSTSLRDALKLELRHVVKRPALSVFTQWILSHPDLKRWLQYPQGSGAEVLAHSQLHPCLTQGPFQTLLCFLQGRLIVKYVPPEFVPLLANIVPEALRRLSVAEQEIKAYELCQVDRNMYNQMRVNTGDVTPVSYSLLERLPQKLRADHVRRACAGFEWMGPKRPYLTYVKLLPPEEAYEIVMAHIQNSDRDVRSEIWTLFGDITHKAQDILLPRFLDRVSKSVREQDPVRQNIIYAILAQHRACYATPEYRDLLASYVLACSQTIDLSRPSLHNLYEICWNLWPYNPTDVITDMVPKLAAHIVCEPRFKKPLTVPRKEISETCWTLLVAYIKTRTEQGLDPKCDVTFDSHLVEDVVKYAKGHSDSLLDWLFSMPEHLGKLSNLINMLSHAHPSYFRKLVPRLYTLDPLLLREARVAEWYAINKPEVFKDFFTKTNREQNDDGKIQYSSVKLYRSRYFVNWDKAIQREFATLLVASLIKAQEYDDTWHLVRVWALQLASLPAIDPRVIVALLCDLSHEEILDTLQEVVSKVDNKGLMLSRLIEALSEPKNSTHETRLLIALRHLVPHLSPPLMRKLEAWLLANPVPGRVSVLTAAHNAPTEEAVVTLCLKDYEILSKHFEWRRAKSIALMLKFLGKSDVLYATCGLETLQRLGVLKRCYQPPPVSLISAEIPDTTWLMAVSSVVCNARHQASDIYTLESALVRVDQILETETLKDKTREERRTDGTLFYARQAFKCLVWTLINLLRNSNTHFSDFILGQLSTDGLALLLRVTARHHDMVSDKSKLFIKLRPFLDADDRKSLLAYALISFATPDQFIDEINTVMTLVPYIYQSILHAPRLGQLDYVEPLLKLIKAKNELNSQKLEAQDNLNLGLSKAEDELTLRFIASRILNGIMLRMGLTTHCLKLVNKFDEVNLAQDIVVPRTAYTLA